MAVYYFDISKKGKDLLGTKDVPILTNEQALKEAITNLLNTQPNSKLMNPEYGIDLDRYLFDPIDDLTASLMKMDIERGLKTFETRISNLNVIVIPDEENITYYINLSFQTNFSNSIQEMKFDFKKIR